ncbi:MAG: ABC transporter substrate-binding protein [Candidatus Lambdaproteobacteria bacterium]|nr:ABC transporter substrate-binding protein [Candidatus Lambdaproteobacteria bacterium]
MSIEHNRRISRAAAALATVALLAMGLFGGAVSAKEYVIGMQCDRSGPTKPVGAYMCPGFHDYIKVFNKKNTIPGSTIRVMEIDHGYQVPRGIEAYERFKEAGAVSIALFGTPHTVSLTPKLTEDQILGTSPGFGSAAGANGEKFPFLFPLAASYWSQAASAVKFIQDNWKGAKQPKIAYMYYDNPAGREPFPIMDDLQKMLGFEMEKYAVPAPGIEMRPQVLDVTRKFKADWVMGQFFGRAPTVSLKEFARMGYPRDRMIGFVWAGGESDISVAGWEQSEGYYTIQFAWVGSSSKNLNQPILQEIAEVYKAEGKPAPEEMDVSVYYNRGVMAAAVHAESIRWAVGKYGEKITGKEVKEGMENVKNFALPGGFMAPVTMSGQDHEGGGAVRIFQVHNGGFRPATDWFVGYREVVMKHVAAGE